MELLILLASRAGELVRREEIVQELWGDEINVDTENAINTAIRKIRQALGDDSSHPQFVQTISKRGYRFLAGPAQPVTQTAPATSPSNSVRWPLLMGTVVLLCVGVGLVIWNVLRSGKVLRVSNYTAITHDGQPKQGPPLSDGVRIYIISGTMNQRRVSQISVHGGEATTLVSTLESPWLMDLSPDRSELLATSFGPHSDLSLGQKTRLNESALWSISLPSGVARRVGNVLADAAAYTPDGQAMAIGWENALYLADRHGADQRKIAQLPGTLSAIRWSPDGKRLRMTVMDATTLRSSLWEVTRDGTSAQELLAGWNPFPAECCGRWSPDGCWYIFQSTREGKTDLWALSEPSGLIDRRIRKPIQLTAGQINSLAPEMSPDGSKLYMIGQQLRGELDRYDARLEQFVPYLNGISAEYLDSYRFIRKQRYFNISSGLQ